MPRPGAWPLFRRLIEEGLAGAEPALAEYIFRWSAHALQRPELPAEVALTLIGGKGTGKSTYGREKARIFGQHGLAVAGAKSLTNNFNKHLHGCCLLFSDEAVAPGDRNAAGLLQSFITEPTILIEPKGVDSFPAQNRLKVVIASNDRSVVDASQDERRYAVFNVSPHLAAAPGSGGSNERAAFWRDLNRELRSGGLEAFAHDMQALDLGDWHPRYDVPQGGGLSEQKAASLRGVERVWYDHLQTGVPPTSCAPRRLGDDSFQLSSASFRTYCHDVAKQRTVELNDIGDLMGEGRKTRTGVVRERGMRFERGRDRPRGWVVPPLPDARRRWDEVRWPGDWVDTSSWGLDSGAWQGAPEGEPY